MKQELEQAVAAAVKNVSGTVEVVELARPDEQFGDYATNVALQLAAKLHQSPREIAETLQKELSDKLKGKAEVSVAGPGFLNIRLSGQALLAAIQAGGPKAYAGQTIVIETNNPNPFKDMHIGHAYNSIIADTLANLLVAGQGEVHRVSYHGDVGLHVGKSMWAILRYLGGDITKLQAIPETGRPKFLSDKYVEGAAAYEQDEAARQEIEQLTKESFTLRDPLFKEAYETCKAWSFAYFDRVFREIGSKPTEKRYLESQADAAGRATVEENTGTVFERSGGAVVFPGEKYGLHTRVFITSRGTTLYEARDLGLMQLKQRDFHPQASYIVTAIEQKEYFRVVFKAAELILPELAGVTRNVSTGTVKLSTGKMSSRTGKVINISWLFDEIESALRKRGATDASLRDGLVGALRYTLLKNRIGGDIIFDINEAISLEGNSGPYLQYAHARACSIIAKAPAPPSDAPMAGLEKDERSLLRKLAEYPEVVGKATAELLPHYICTYLYELAQGFNSFYEHNRVIGDARQEVRLALVGRYADTLKAGLELLGITAPNHM